jgi:hypothetical protein
VFASDKRTSLVYQDKLLIHKKVSSEKFSIYKTVMVFQILLFKKDIGRCYDAQHNDIHHNNIYHNAVMYDIQHKRNSALQYRVSPF